MMDAQTVCSRWRLILGEFAEESLPLTSGRELDEALGFLYDREYAMERGMRKRGGSGSPALTVPAWLKRVKRLFPRKTVEIMQKQALDRYHMTELLTDVSVLRAMEPNMDLLKNILTFRSVMPRHVKKAAYEIVARVVRELTELLRVETKRVFYGKRLPHSSSHHKMYRNFDVKRTISENLRYYDPAKRAIAVRRLYFRQNSRRHTPWDVIILVDESGSMTDSVIYSAVMASIFAGLPFLSVRLAIFDTVLVDLSEHLDDPVGVLMKVQLGGGTDIYRALEYAKKQVAAPHKTIVVLVSDLYDGNDYRLMLRSGRDLVESGCRLFVLPALDYDALSCYDQRAARGFAALGAHVAAITPEELAKWIGNTVL